MGYLALLGHVSLKLASLLKNYGYEAVFYALSKVPILQEMVIYGKSCGGCNNAYLSQRGHSFRDRIDERDSSVVGSTAQKTAILRHIFSTFNSYVHVFLYFLEFSVLIFSPPSFSLTSLKLIFLRAVCPQFCLPQLCLRNHFVGCLLA